MQAPTAPPTYESEILDHLGLVAGMYDELEIGRRIDSCIAQDLDQREVSVGQAVKAMVLNGLGFVQQSLYLTPRFFKNRPTERLIGEGIRPEHLNDDALGRAMGSLYDYGATELFRDLSAHAATQIGLTPRFAHLDATSFLAHGEYGGDKGPEEGITQDGVIEVRKGYSRDQRPDLNQVVLNLVVEHKAGLPVLMEPLSGNASDQGSFRELIDRHVDHLQNAHGFDYVVADSALYSAGHIQDLDEAGTKFVTRVPGTLNEVQQAIQNTDLADLKPLSDGYRAREKISEYGDVRQRWLIVYSEAAADRATESAENRRDREHEAEKRDLRELEMREFSCREDAEKALSAFEEDLTGSEWAKKQVLPATCFIMDEEGMPVETGEKRYLLQGKLLPSESRRTGLLKKKSFFIVATNELDENRLSGRELLEGYKGQSKVERGFRFLKDPQFVASSLFLESQRRIMALLMVMTLCLLVCESRVWARMDSVQPSSYFLRPSPTSRFPNRAFGLSPNLGSLRRPSEGTSASLFRRSLPQPHSGKHLQVPFHHGQVSKFGSIMPSLPPAVTTNHFDSGPTSATSALRFESSLSAFVIVNSFQLLRDYYADSATPRKRWPVWGPFHFARRFPS